MQLDKNFVDCWSGRYIGEELGDSGLEHELLGPVHQAITDRGHVTSGELAKIVTWKSRRTTGILEADPDTIRDVTRVAFDEATPDWMRHHILCILKGVQHPVASAILTIRYPDTHTVVDDRAIGAVRKLWQLGLLGTERPLDASHYWSYLHGVFRPLAASLRVQHRDLDRALWKWHKEGMPET